MNYLFTKNIAIALLAISLTSCASSQNGEKIKSLISPSSESEVATTIEPQETEDIPQSSPKLEENEPKTITQSSSGITPQQINRRVKQFTVRIDGAQNGSGVIIDQSNDTYTVLTNWHVVQEAGNYTIQTSDGRQHQVNYQQVEQLPGVDLALVKFTSEQNYQTAEVGDSDYLSEGQGVHLAGYPGVKTNDDRLYRFYNLNIVGLLDKPINQGYSVLYEGETISGMSGSPLLNGDGDLVGIHGIYRVDDPTIRKGSSYAIPINTYKKLIAEQSESTEEVALQPSPVDTKEDTKTVDNSTTVGNKNDNKQSQPSNTATKSSGGNLIGLEETPSPNKEMIMDLQKLGVFDNLYWDFNAIEPITRGQYTALLYYAQNAIMPPDHRIRLAPGYNPGLTDIDSSHPAYKYVQAFANARFFVGYEDNTFKPDQPITHEEMIATKFLIDSGREWEPFNSNQWGFNDWEQIDKKYTGYIVADKLYCYELEEVTDPNTPCSNILRAFGNIDYFNPQQAVFGYEAAATLWRFGSGSHDSEVVGTATGIIKER